MSSQENTKSEVSAMVASPKGGGREGAIKVGIIGGAGYTGGELIRLLLNHPGTELSFIHSRSNAGKPVYAVHQDLLGETEIKFTDHSTSLKEGSIDVLFLCVGHGEAKQFFEEFKIAEQIKVIDFSQDFRLIDKQRNGARKFIYGLPELNRDQIKAAANIANPGCFATAIQLGLLPLAKAGLLKEVHTTGITGSTGAGQSLTGTSHFSWRSNNIQSYKTLTHQHLGEINQSLKQLQPAGDIDFSFIPWRGDFARGIFTSSLVKCDVSEEELVTLFNEFYKGHPFVHLSKEPIFLKQVVNTNNAVIQLEKVENKLVIHSATDNLLKGASGQAVQNMNLMFGIDETTGLKLKANYF
jgi:N-acetyl-gamma-glutamyl-phosphate reductase